MQVWSWFGPRDTGSTLSFLLPMKMTELSELQRKHFSRMSIGERQEAMRETRRELSIAESLATVAPSDAIRAKVANLQARIAFLTQLARKARHVP